MTDEQIRLIAEMEANVWAESVHLRDGPDRDRLAAQKATLIKNDLGEALRILDQAGFVCVPKNPPDDLVETMMDNNPTSWTEDTDNNFPCEVVTDIYAAIVRWSTALSQEKGR